MIINTTFTARGDADPRIAELREVEAAGGCKIRLTIDMINVILWYEDMGYTLDLTTGIAYAIVSEDERGIDATGSGVAVNHLLAPVTERDVEQTYDSLFAAGDYEECEPDGALQDAIEAGHDEAWYEAQLQDLRDDMDDRAYHASGNW